MNTALTIGIIIGAVLLVGVIALVVWVVHVVRLSSKTPAQIHVRKSDITTWKDQRQRDATIKQLRELDFVELGFFSIDEMPLVPLAAFVNESANVLAVLYEHPLMGQWLDFASKFEDGTTLTVSSATMGHQLDHRPGHEKFYLAKAAPDALFAKVTEVCANRPQLAAANTAAGFIETMQRAYNDDMQWRNSRGGATMDELKRIAEESGFDTSAQTLEGAQLVHQKDAYDAFLHSLVETLKDKGTIPTAGCKEFEDSLLMVHDNMTPTLLEHVLILSSQPHDVSASQFKTDASLRAAFTAWNETLPSDRRFQKIAAVSEPLPVDLYRSRHSDN
jgi:hypothetical protein